MKELYHIEMRKDKGQHTAELWVSEVLDGEIDNVTIMGTVRSDNFWVLLLRVAKKGWIKHL